MDSFKRVVRNMLVRYGTVITVITAKAGTYNANTSEYVYTEKRYDVRAMILDLTLQSNGLLSQAGTLIQAGDKQVFIEPISDELALPSLDPTKDKLKIGDEIWNIVTLKEVNPSYDDRVLIEAYIRR